MSLISLICLAVCCVTMIILARKNSDLRAQLLKKDRDINALEHNLDEYYRIIDSQNGEISRLNKKLRNAKLITTMDDLEARRSCEDITGISIKQ